MKQTELKKILSEKLLKHSLKIKILVNGRWGIGKSFLLNELAKDADPKYHFLYISLFGLNTMEEIKKKLKREYLLTGSNANTTFLNKSLQTVTENKAIKSVLSHFSKKYIGLSLDPMELIPLRLDETFIVCVDDLERKSPLIRIEDVLGLIEDIGLQCKVIVVINDEKIPQVDRQVYDDFKEKIIDRSYILDEVDGESVKKIIEKQLPNYKYNDTIYDFFMGLEMKNLRTLYKCTVFVKEISSLVSIDGVLTKVCCAIVNEDVISTNLETLTQIAIGENKGSFYTKYNFSRNTQFVLQELVRYFKYGRFDKEKIIEYLHPNKTESQLMLENLQEFWLKNEKELVGYYNRITTALDAKDYRFFQNCERLFYLIFYLQAYKSLLGFTFDIVSLVEKAKKAVVYLVDIHKTDAMMDIMFIETQFGDNNGIIKPLLNFYSAEFMKLTSEANVVKYRELFEKCIYDECSQIINDNPTIIPLVMDTLDLVINPECSKELFRLIFTIVAFSRYDKTLHTTIVEKLNKFIEQDEDKVVKYRIQTIVNNY